MRITLRQLEVFAAVVDAGSTSAAGERVSLSQSAASAALIDLESALDVALFDRIGARLMINDVGRAVLAQARGVIDGAAAIERDFRHHAGAAPPVQLRVGASTTIGNYLLPNMVASWKKAYPNSNVDIQIGNTADIADAVARLEVDFAFIEGACYLSEVISEPWRNDELVIVASPDHPDILNGLPLDVDTLRQQSWLLREPGSGTREAAEQALLPHLLYLNEGMRFGGTEAIKAAVASGIGFSCLSETAVQDFILLKRLVRVQTSLPVLSRGLSIARHRAKQLSFHTRAFIDHCLA